MKTRSLKLVAAVTLLTAGFFAGPTGCAGTSTRESTGEYLDDSAITTKVKTALVRDEIVKGRDVSVETFKGIVQLSGFVDTAEQKTRAALLAARVSGVRNVKNNLVVK